jgi:hypothetical protein
MTTAPRLSSAQSQFAADYPPSGHCPAKAVDSASLHHVWSRDWLGAVHCADCQDPYPHEEFAGPAESDLDWMQSVCDAQGPSYGGTWNRSTQRLEFYNGLHLVDDEEGADLTFYLVARIVLPELLSAYRRLRDQETSAVGTRATAHTPHQLADRLTLTPSISAQEAA